MKRKMFALTLVCLIATVLTGCASLTSGESEISLTATSGETIAISATNEHYKLKKGSVMDGKVTFLITGGSTDVHGDLISALDADTLSAAYYEDSSYSMISVGNMDGFAYVVGNGNAVHVFGIKGDDNMPTVYVRLTCESLDAVYGAEAAIACTQTSAAPVKNLQ